MAVFTVRGAVGYQLKFAVFLRAPNKSSNRHTSTIAVNRPVESMWRLAHVQATATRGFEAMEEARPSPHSGKSVKLCPNLDRQLFRGIRYPYHSSEGGSRCQPLGPARCGRASSRSYPFPSLVLWGGWLPRKMRPPKTLLAHSC